MLLWFSLTLRVLLKNYTLLVFVFFLFFSVFSFCMCLSKYKCLDYIIYLQEGLPSIEFGNARRYNIFCLSN